MSKVLVSVSALLLSMSGGQAVSQKVDDRGDRDRAITFFHDVQSALRQGDAEQLSHMAEYPMLSNIHGKKVWIRNPETFKRDFAFMFTTHTRQIILGFHDADVWLRPDDGYSVGDGIIWMDARMPKGQQFPSVDSPDFWRAGKFKLITVNGAASFEKGCAAP
jgi:hypothetical protein